MLSLGHQNYSRFGAFQHVNLQSLGKEDEERSNELKEKGFCASFTGDIFSTIHGGLVTELFNKETKGTSVDFRCNFSRRQSIITFALKGKGGRSIKM